MTKKNMYEEGKITKKIRENPWIVSTFVLGILCLILLVEEFVPEKVVVNVDSFAQCLTDNGFKMYGTEWCSFCKQQKEYFGSSFEIIDYIDCDLDKESCISAEVQGYPTWKINNVNYPGVQSFERLSSLSGCYLE